MVYDANIPQPGDFISTSQGQILGNFQLIGNSFNYDPAVGGFNQVTFKNATGDPNLASPAATLYTKTVAGLSQLFYQNNVTAAAVAQITGNLTSAVGADGYTHYTVKTPWGIIFKFGLCNASNVPIAVVFPVAYPTNGFGVIFTPRVAGALATAYTALTVNGFNAYLPAGPGTQTCSYFSWGN